MIHFSEGVSIPRIDTYQPHGNYISMRPPFLLFVLCVLSRPESWNLYAPQQEYQYIHIGQIEIVIIIL